MSRNTSIYSQGYNRTLDLIGEVGVGGELPTETALSDRWDVSRTTVRGILKGLQEAKIIQWSGRSKTILRKPKHKDYYPDDETYSHADRLPSLFMEYIFEGGLVPGETLNESELARHFEISSTVLREFLIRFSRFALIEKKPNRHWVLNGFTREFAEELFAVREMFELRAFMQFLNAGVDEHRLALDLKTEHTLMLQNMETDFLQFPRLDEKFHRIWVDGLGNRFVRDFFELISLVFHYHYRWNKVDEMERNRNAAKEHLNIINALEKGDLKEAESAFFYHLAQSKETLFASVAWDAKNQTKT